MRARHRGALAGCAWLVVAGGAGCSTTRDQPPDAGRDAAQDGAGGADGQPGEAGEGAAPDLAPADAGDAADASDAADARSDVKRETAPDGTPTAVEIFCASAYDALAAREAACTGFDRALLDNLGDETYTCPRIDAAVKGGLLTYSAADASACLTALGTLDCNEADRGAPVVPACAKALVGTIAVGGACASLSANLFSECVAGAFCDGCPGVCTKYAKAGESCASGETCAPGTSCTLAAMCVADSAPGDACAGPVLGGCRPGSFCAGGDTSMTGVCTARKASGPCDSDEECAVSLECAMGADGGAGTCVAHKKLGDPCVMGNGECMAVGICGPASTCVPYPGLGGDCGLVGGELAFCAAGYCDAGLLGMGKCQPFVGPGADCTGIAPDECGPGGTCDGPSGVCVDSCGP